MRKVSAFLFGEKFCVYYVLVSFYTNIYFHITIDVQYIHRTIAYMTYWYMYRSNTICFNAIANK